MPIINSARELDVYKLAYKAALLNGMIKRTGELASWRRREKETGRLGDWETGRKGDREIGRPGEKKDLKKQE